MTRSPRRLVPFLALLALAAACGGSATSTTAAPTTTTTEAAAPTEETTREEMMGDVLEVAAAEGDLGLFLDALGAAGIMEDFHGEGPFTLFIPTDEAFNSYLTKPA